MALGVAYLAIMLIGSRLLERPPAGWKPEGWTPPANEARDDRRSQRDAQRRDPHAAVLPAVGDPLHQRHRRHRHPRAGIADDAGHVSAERRSRPPPSSRSSASSTPSGRFVWASASDYIGRRNTYTIFFVAQFVLFLLIPGLAASGNWIAVRGQRCSRCSRCTAAASRRFRRSSPTSSVPTTSAPFTARCSPRGAARRSPDR